MPKLWKFLPQVSTDLREQLLINRGLTTQQQIEQFFHPKLEHYESLLNLSGLEEAEALIRKAIENGKMIFIYGDYDVDGVAATTIMYHGLKALGAKVLPYIPHREKEGYGLSIEGLNYIIQEGGELVITVDNGIVALASAEHAKKLGLDLIITDHHVDLEEKPQADAIIHSTQMSGAAVAWCLIRRLISQEQAQKLLQFVALGTVCDLLPLIDLGRFFIIEGLKELNQTDNLGLRALILESGLTLGRIGTYEISHILGPRLNAVGRLEHAIEALRLLCTKDLLKATRLARLLCDTNAKRQQLTLLAYEEAKLQINQGKKIHILQSTEWSPGIIGLVAGRIAEDFAVPTIAISVGEEISKGSARSVDGINIIETIRKFADLFLDVGGHAAAAGFTIETSKISLLQDQLEAAELEGESTPGTLEIEALLTPDQINHETINLIEEFAPFGLGNNRPLFVCKNLVVSGMRLVGNNGKHLKFLADGIEAIGFNLGARKSELSDGMRVDLAFRLELNRYNGKESVQLNVVDWRPAS